MALILVFLSLLVIAEETTGLHCTKSVACVEGCWDGSCFDDDTLPQTFPPGGQLCAGSGCKCCLYRRIAKCVNRGGNCFGSCPSGFEEIPGGTTDECHSSSVCCVRTASKACIEVDGICVKTGQCDSKRKVISNVDCGSGHVCCVHKSRAECAKAGGRCFKSKSKRCPNNYESAGGSGRKCRGRKLKCCRPT